MGENRCYSLLLSITHAHLMRDIGKSATEGQIIPRYQEMTSLVYRRRVRARCDNPSPKSTQTSRRFRARRIQCVRRQGEGASSGSTSESKRDRRPHCLAPR